MIIFWKMFEMKLATCATLMGVLPESTDSFKTSYLSRENTYSLVIVDFEVEEVRYALNFALFLPRTLVTSLMGCQPSRI